MQRRSLLLFALCLLAAPALSARQSPAAELLVGTATADIAPTGPVTLRGQFYLRIARTADTPLLANVAVLESRQGDQSLDTAIMVSCDLCGIDDEVLNLVRQEIQKRVPELDTKKIFLNATHTHTGPVTNPDSWYAIPKEGVMPVEVYRAFLVERIAEAIQKAWNARQAGSVTWGVSDAVVAYNRRAVYADGHAQMYGKTDRPDFRGLEGCEDNDVGTLFFWNKEGKLLAIAINVSSPSQEVMHGMAIHADFWHFVREGLHQQYGPDVCILAWTGAAGDQNPYPYILYPKAAERMHGPLKWNQRVVDRFEAQKTDPKPTYEVELHVLRIGDAAICTNPFELFTEYGIRIKARSKAIQTFLVQLAGRGSYLPTEQAVRGGSYSAVVQSCPVGPEGGQVLVDRTVEAINALWSQR